VLWLRAACLACWAAAPWWLKALLRAETLSPCDSGRCELPAPQQRLLRFLLEPSDDVDCLLEAAAGAHLSEAITRRLVWLAVACWIDRVEACPGVVHEVLLDGYVRLWHAWGPDFWEAPIDRDSLAWPNRARQVSLTHLGMAWLRYRESLRWIQGEATLGRFARREAVSHLAAGQAAGVLALLPACQEEEHGKQAATA
jgi:hypothetical protein